MKLHSRTPRTDEHYVCGSLSVLLGRRSAGRGVSVVAGCGSAPVLRTLARGVRSSEPDLPPIIFITFITEPVCFGRWSHRGEREEPFYLRNESNAFSMKHCVVLFYALGPFREICHCGWASLKPFPQPLNNDIISIQLETFKEQCRITWKTTKIKWPTSFPFLWQYRSLISAFLYI
jgi:hypothetical protein